jgi:hypothetical protein
MIEFIGLNPMTWGLFLQLIGVTFGAISIREIILSKSDRLGIFRHHYYHKDEIEKLPKHPKTNQPIFPLIIDRHALVTSVVLIMIGLWIQIFDSIGVFTTLFG